MTNVVTKARLCSVSGFAKTLDTEFYTTRKIHPGFNELHQSAINIGGTWYHSRVANVSENNGTLTEQRCLYSNQAGEYH